MNHENNGETLSWIGCLLLLFEKYTVNKERKRDGQMKRYKYTANKQPHANTLTKINKTKKLWKIDAFKHGYKCDYEPKKQHQIRSSFIKNRSNLPFWIVICGSCILNRLCIHKYTISMCHNHKTLCISSKLQKKCRYEYLLNCIDNLMIFLVSYSFQ